MEPVNTGIAVAKWGVDYIVVTSVDRDDVEDMGSGHFAQTVKEIKKKLCRSCGVCVCLSVCLCMCASVCRSISVCLSVCSQFSATMAYRPRSIGTNGFAATEKTNIIVFLLLKMLCSEATASFTGLDLILYI